MVIHPTPYANPFVAMNPHICRPRAGNLRQLPVVGATVVRNPPAIVGQADEVRARLMATFRFLPAIFEQHPVHFAAQDIAVHDGWGAAMRTAIDVRYRWSNEYFHFLTEALPNALLMDCEAPGLPVSCGAARFTHDLLRWFGVRGPIVWASPLWQRVRCQYVECGNPSPEKIEAIRGVVRATLRFEKTHGILIRRQRSRRIFNEADLLRALRGRFPDLEWVVFDLLSAADTARLFAKAAVIAGPHGAGFANMLFSGSGTQIIEFMPLEQPNLCYWHLAEMLGNPYLMIPCRSDRTRSMVAELGPDNCGAIGR